MFPDQRSSLVHAQLHDRPVEIGLGDDLGPDEGLLDVVDQRRGRKTGRIVYIKHLTLSCIYLIGNVRDSRDYIHVELSEKTLLHDLKVQKSEESATETESQSQRGLRLIDK